MKTGVMTMDEKSLLSPVIAAAERNQPKDSSDYIGEDGLLMCGKCRTPKQHRLVAAGQQLVVPVMCECQKKAEEAEQERERMEKEMQCISKLRHNSLMDDKFRESTFETFHTKKDNARILKLCKRYATGFEEMMEKNQGLLLYGDVGTGKTFAAACIANYLLDRGIPVVMTSFVKILELVQGFRGEEEERYIRRMNQAKLLIIDDLGAERSTEFAMEKVYNIIDSRYRAKKPLILTTNLTMADMKEATDIRYSRIYDRIFEICYPIGFTGTSWRKGEAARRFNEMKQFLEG